VAWFTSAALRALLQWLPRRVPQPPGRPADRG